MSKKANPTFVGAFIVSGLLLAVAGVVIFGSFRFFSPLHTFIVYFEDSAQGLQPGAQVKYRGVRIGKVKEVMIRFNQKTDDNSLPVLIEIDEQILRAKMDDPTEVTDPKRLVKLIDRGLRAQLELESFVTGQLYVSLEILSTNNKPVFHQNRNNLEYFELPSSPTDFSKLKRSLGQVDIVGITSDLKMVLNKLAGAVDDLNLKTNAMALNATLKRIEELVGSPEITNAIASIRLTSDEFRAVATQLKGQVDPTASNLNKTMNELQDTLSEARKALEGVNDMTAARGPLRQEISATLVNMTEAARSLAELAEFLRRNPQSLITGKQLPNSK